MQRLSTTYAVTPKGRRINSCTADHQIVLPVMTDIFQKNGIIVSRKLAKIVRRFVDTGHIKNQGVIYWPERIGPVIPTLWSGHDFSQKS
jgi:hypothetical protein